MVWPPGQSICFIKSSWFVCDGEVKLGEKQGPAGLAAGKFLFCSEVGEVVVVHPDFKKLRMSFKVVTEGFKGMDDGKKFFVVDVVILFDREHGFRVKGDRVPAVERVRLFEDIAKSKVTGVSY